MIEHGVAAEAALPMTGVQPLLVLLVAAACWLGGVALVRLSRRVRSVRPDRSGAGSAAGEQSGHRRVEVQVVGLAAARNRDIGTAQEAHEHAAGYLEQGIAVGRGQR